MNKINKEIGEGILRSLKSIDSLNITYLDESGGYSFKYNYSFQLDDFNIRISVSEGCARLFGIPVASDGGYRYDLYIDDTYIKINHIISKKIYNRVMFLYTKVDNDNNNFIKRDAHIHFRQ